MPPLPQPPNPLPRIITYYQTHHDPSGKHISVLPLLTQPAISVTHVILAAIHLNHDPRHLTLNDHSPDHPRFHTLWAELRVLQAAGVKVLGMLGGAAPGTFRRLDGSDAQFEAYYASLRDLVRARALDGLDLDVEENMSLGGIINLIDRLRSDFGSAFIITLAPVAMALLDVEKNLSGFDYEALEVMRGKEIAWYNTQFYCGWGNLSNTDMYDLMLQKGWDPEKIVVGLVTNPANGRGFVPWHMLSVVLSILKRRHQTFGGVMGWEYFNSLPGDTERPWEWARHMTSLLRNHALSRPPVAQPDEPAFQHFVAAAASHGTVGDEIDPDEAGGAPLEVPRQFDYYSDGCGDD
ncbi:Chitinase 1 [Tolypocladium capitatum]|uniref:Chitinase 1 n=1 Tax=Tolypocladium capitatum TaxID=45235 RepID=A0A2K3QGI9_9HYPO|nr:Chitinase 1 [Tolypocladium capitatum]